MEIARFNPRVRIELWMDLYTGRAEPRVWIGFYSPNRAKIISSLVTSVRSVGFGRTVLRRYWRDVHRKRGIWQFKEPLSAREFDVQILETYGTGAYLGAYMAYSWPLTKQSKRALVRHCVNYVAAMWAAYNSAAPNGRRTVGPWNRPDKAIERAAVRYVRAKLIREGYRVRSRESEICGYDLHATRNRDELHVEVKGCSGPDPHFGLDPIQWTG